MRANKLNKPNKKQIVFKNVSYTYGPKSPYEFEALKDISISFPLKKITAVIGSTGSGKTTLVQHINGLLIPSKGEVLVNDFCIKAKQKKIRKIKQLRSDVGLVFQFPEYQLFEETVAKDIMFGPIQFGIDKPTARKLSQKYIKAVGLPLNYLVRSPFDLSGGQKRRVAVAGILAMQGNILILDEPTAGLDPKGEKDFNNLFLNINKKEKKTIILVTHNMDHVLQIADYVLVLDKNKIVNFDTPDKIFANKDLVKKLNIAPPQLYQLIYDLNKKGIQLDNKNIRSINDLCSELAKLKERK